MSEAHKNTGVVHKCRSCGGTLSVPFADLGMQPPSNNYLPDLAAAEQEKFYPLNAVVCEKCRLVQVGYDVPPEELFGDYAYFSSYSDSWLEHARRYCEMATERFHLGEKSLVVELASNDGYLLKNFVAQNIPVLGIDPSGTVAAAAEKIGVPTLVKFFGAKLAGELVAGGKKADLIIGNNVLAHVPAINDFVLGIKTLLADNGTVTIEFPHLVTLINKVAFDTIYHEHFSYLSLLAVEKVFERNGLRLYDVEQLPTHGGSLRIFGCHAGLEGRPDSETLKRVRAEEADLGLDGEQVYRDFARKVAACGESLKAFLAEARAQGKTVAAYGAAAKGNTLLNFIRAGREDIVMVADRSPHKQGKLLPGSHIPIVTPEEMMAVKPDYILILPWNLKDEIIAQLAGARDWGCRFVTPVPLTKVF